MIIVESEYPSMINSAKLIPNNVNVKLVIRHSTRNSLKGVEKPDDIPLTEDGMTKAINFGKGLKLSIGDVYSSTATRCRQTIDCILDGANIKRSIETIDMSKYYASDIIESINTFKKEGSGKNVLLKLSNNISLPGFYSIRKCTLNQLNLIFNSIENRPTIDIYCTHDFQIMCIISALFKKINSMETIKENWPNMLEGLFFWGNLNDFYCIWRGEKIHIKDQNF